MKLKVYRNDELVNEFGNGHATRSFLQALANKAIHAILEKALQHD